MINKESHLPTRKFYKSNHRSMHRLARHRPLVTERRKGELIMMGCGVGVAIIGLIVSVQFVSYAGLCVLGLGVISVFWK